MNPETRTTSTSSVQVCQNCKQSFVIEPDDFAFYGKIQVPPPSWCPECRMRRRAMWRNEHSLYWRECKLCGEKTLSLYSPEKDLNVYCAKCWWSDKWGDLKSGREFNQKESFFTQFSHLLRDAPLVALSNINPVNSDYVNFTTNSKNCYLLFAAGAAASNENCFYSYRLDGDKNCLDCSYVISSENCYEDVQVYNCNRVIFGNYLEGSFDVSFAYDVRNCSNCFGIANLRNKQFIIFGEQFTKEEYFKKSAGFDTGSYNTLEDYKNHLDQMKRAALHKFANLTKTSECSGNDIFNSKNCKDSFYVRNSENVRYAIDSPAGIRDSYDLSQGGGELIYESVAAVSGVSKIHFAALSSACKNTQYSYWNVNCSDIFGCIGLRNKQYCILNKEYSKEEYEKLVPRIIEHMNSMPYVDARGRVYKYGEFFPPELSPFAYNETIAQEYFPLTKEEAIERGYRWRDPEERHYDITIKPDDLPDHIKDVGDSILKETIQ